MPTAAEPAALAGIRRILLLVFLLGTVGTGVELLLLEHTEDVWQLIPVILFPLALAPLAWYRVTRSAASLRTFQTGMLLFIVSGGLGTWLHYRGNVEFELEMSPALGGWPLFREAMTGATPSLAPGAMLWLGLIGLAFTFRHPALARRPESPSPRPDE